MTLLDVIILITAVSRPGPGPGRQSKVHTLWHEKTTYFELFVKKGGLFYINLFRLVQKFCFYLLYVKTTLLREAQLLNDKLYNVVSP